MDLRPALLSTALLVPVAAFALAPSAPDPDPAPAVVSSAPTTSVKAFAIDAAHSSVVFRVKHFDVSYYYGRFNDVAGVVVFDEADPTATSVEVEIKAESVDTNNEGRDNHLRGPDFFNAKEYPSITFKSTKVEQAGDEYKVTGELTMHGVTKEITADVEHVATAETQRGVRAGFEAKMTIKRSDFGVSYGVGEALGDDVSLILSFECVEQG